jgi:hypothetical protein
MRSGIKVDTHNHFLKTQTPSVYTSVGRFSLGDLVLRLVLSRVLILGENWVENLF